MRSRLLILTLGGVATLVGGSAHGGVMLFDNRDEWAAALGNPVTTVDFVGFPGGTLITDQYSELGVLFTDSNDHVFVNSSFLNDGVGLDGNSSITVAFDTLQFGFAADFPGINRYRLFRDGELIHMTSALGGPGKGWFVGLIFTEPFDEVAMDDPFGFEVSIDDLHFGIPTPSGLALLAVGGLVGCRRKR